MYSHLGLSSAHPLACFNFTPSLPFQEEHEIGQCIHIYIDLSLLQWTISIVSIPRNPVDSQKVLALLHSYRHAKALKSHGRTCIEV